jgi:pimeloyl-ACP methyl ester carboxylesterase
LLPLLVFAAPAHADELGEKGFADSGAVKIHYVTAGKGPLVVLLHGFPDSAGHNPCFAVRGLDREVRHV